MGHKVHPMGFRIGVIRDWQAKWYAEKQFSEFVQEDLKIRQAIQTKYLEAGISQVEISRQANEVSITIYTSRPGVVIGRGGQRVDEMRLHLEKLIDKKVRLNILEVQQPELDAYLVARVVAEQLERRIAYRRAVKQAIARTIQAGAKGVRIRVAGRLGGAEIARAQTLHEGQVPLHTLRADIDYGFTEAHTTFGRIGVKVWIYRGEILPEREEAAAEEETAPEAIGAEAEGEFIEPAAEAAQEAETVAPEAEKPMETEAVPAAVKTTRKARAAAPEPAEKPSEPEAEIETKPKAKAKTKGETATAAEKKPTRTRTKRPKAAPETAEGKDEGEAEEAAPEVTGEEEKDVTAEAGETSQES